MYSFQPSCWSEHGELTAVMLCAPSSLDVPDLKIAENVQWSAPVLHARAMENFMELKGTLQHAGVQVIDYSTELLADAQQLSEQLLNRYFVRDLACVFGNQMLSGEAGSSIRRPEYGHAHTLLEKWFPQNFKASKETGDVLEFGDVMVLNKDAVLINIGVRTTKQGVERVKQRIFEAGFSEIGIIDLPRSSDTLHLDMNCNVANEDVVIAKSFMRYFPVYVMTASTTRFDMTEQFFNRHGFDIYWLEKYNTIPDINFLNLNPETLLVSKKATKQQFKNHPKLQKKNIVEIEVTELEKGGGGIRCMTLPLVRKL
ncbi:MULTISPECIES: arginine deiminase family protein [unclassified Lysinibacillus]|uniref:arginine deiminase family protein n=1 Tax=unclassified Lysinibacillus TaxID=2636778 RepID=UPI00380F5BF2